MPPTSRSVPVTRCWLSTIDAPRLLEIVEQPLAEAEQRRAGRRDAHLAAEPQEQLLLQFLLEQQDLAADRGLREVQPLAGAGEGAGVGHGPQDLELAQVHGLD